MADLRERLAVRDRHKRLDPPRAVLSAVGLSAGAYVEIEELAFTELVDLLTMIGPNRENAQGRFTRELLVRCTRRIVDGDDVWEIDREEAEREASLLPNALAAWTSQELAKLHDAAIVEEGEG